MKHEDKFISNGEDLVFNTSKEYIANSTSAYTYEKGVYIPLEVEEMGGTFVLLKSTVTKGNDIFIEYTPKGNLNTEAMSIERRLLQLEEALTEIVKTNLLLKEAINNRLSINSFRAWTKLIEKKTGINLVDSPLGFVDSELYTTRKDYK